MEDNKIPSKCFYIQPLKNDMYKWHFTIIGLPGTVYENGVYHGVIELPDNYPLAPPNVFFWNKSGRYSLNTKICLNVTSWHKEAWSPAWSLRSIMEAFVVLFHTEE